MLERWRSAARALRRDVAALALAMHDPRTPWAARIVAAVVVAYALSPIDLIPDFVPVLGYLDDLLLVPAGLWLAIRLVPAEVLSEHRAAAEGVRLPVSRTAAAVIVALWIAAAAAFVWWLSQVAT